MCGRYVSVELRESIKEMLPFEEGMELTKPSFNIAPGYSVNVIVNVKGEMKRGTFRWGLIPFWAKDIKIGYKMINARSETITEKPSFKHAFKKRRCLIPADGFYEWGKVGGSKVPHYIRMESGEPFTMAGIWEKWKSPEGEVIHSVSIITTNPNEIIKPFHHRMAVIIPEDQHELWLSDKTSEEELKSFLVPFPADQMTAYRVSTKVNSPAFNVPECVEPVSVK